MGVLDCTCSKRAPLCQRCIEDRYATMAGVAGARGANWAQACSRVVPLTRLWPEANERMRELARRKVSDIDAGDEQLSELLVEAVISGARSWWNNVLRRGLWRAG